MPTTAERVAAAARATLGAGSARVWECRFSEPSPSPERSWTQYAEGVADLANVRAQVCQSEPRLWKELGDRIVERWPWLEGGEDEQYDDDFAPKIVYAGTAGYLGNGDDWMPLGLRAGDPHAVRRIADDPLWILEALTSVADAAPRAPAPELVRDERIRRVTWKRPTLHRARSPVKAPPFTSCPRSSCGTSAGDEHAVVAAAALFVRASQHLRVFAYRTTTL